MVGRMARRLWPLLAVGGLLAGVAALSVLSRPGIRSLPIPLSVRKRFAQQTPPPNVHITSVQASGDPRGSHSLNWPAVIVAWLCGAVMVAVVGFLIWYFVKSWLESADARRVVKVVPVPIMTRREAVLAAVDAGIVELARADGDPRAAIIACWVRLEEVAEAAGTARSPGDTSSDLVARLLGDHQVSQSVLTSLATLYRTARYSTAPIEASMRDEALSAFEHLRLELMRSRSGPLADVPPQSDDDPYFAAVAAGAPGEDPRRPSPRPERR